MGIVDREVIEVLDGRWYGMRRGKEEMQTESRRDIYSMT